MLFSAYAEVFLQNCLKPSSDFSFLCLRRGVSWFIGRHPLCEELFSAYAEVFLHHWRPGLAQLTFLCLRRGVSRSGGPCVLTRCFSLPTQRCFQSKCCRKPPTSLFSAYAEVFLSSTALSPSTGTFLCLRRGVSQAFDQPITPPGFSLPTQRCFYV